MPEPIVKEHLRPGLVESAGGSLRCPLCQSDRLTLFGLIYANHVATTTITPAKVLVDPAQGGQLGDGIEAVLMTRLSCHRGHTITVESVTRTGQTKVETQWTEQDEEAS